jgi:hypothetical protein
MSRFINLRSAIAPDFPVLGSGIAYDYVQIYQK